MIALAAPAVIEDALAAVLVTDGAQPRRHLSDSRVPIDPLEGAVRAAPERVGEAITRVLVVIQPERLLAVIALGGGMRPVATYALEAAAVGAELQLDPTIHGAEDARRGVPGPVRRCRHGASWTSTLPRGAIRVDCGAVAH
jgi:hypothetical protein